MNITLSAAGVRAALQREPSVSGESWSAFQLEAGSIGLLLDEERPLQSSSTSVPVLTVPDVDLDSYIARMQQAGAQVVLQGLQDRILLASPNGHEIELRVESASAA